MKEEFKDSVSPEFYEFQKKLKFAQSIDPLVQAYYKVTYIEGKGYKLGVAKTIAGGFDNFGEYIASIEDVLLWIRRFCQNIKEQKLNNKERFIANILSLWNFIAKNPTDDGGAEQPEQLLFTFDIFGEVHFIKEKKLKEQYKRILDGEEAKSEEIQGDASVKQQIRQRLDTIRSGAKAVTKEMVAILHVHDKQEGGA